MICFPNAKINIGLNILEKRKDNFHNLESVFYPVGWTDALEIVRADSFQLTLTGIKVEGDPAENLCAKVYQSLREKFKLAPVHIHLHKNIPVGAGLGGGSSDAAFTLKLLNQLFQLELSTEEMQDFIRPFGSDCAFFIENQPVYAFGKGDQFETIKLDLKGKFLVMVYPALHISTKEAYEGIIPQQPPYRIKESIKSDFSIWREVLANDFEKGIFAKHSLLVHLKEKLYKMGAVYASMSGSGSTVYGIFENEIEVSDSFPSNYKTWTGSLN
jgi:4-diphosphocytidyl-2-C-methyl-D-erythritol kinase